MESKSSVGGGIRSGGQAASDVGSGSTAKPTMQGTPLTAGGSQQHFAEPSHASSGQSTSAASSVPSKEQIKQQASEKAAQAKDAAKQTADQLRQQATQTASRVQEQGAAMLGQQKDRLVEEVSHVSAAVRQAANKLHEENDHNIAGYIDAIADQIDQCTGYLRQRDFSALANDATDLARRRPELFAGGMFVAGLALARFLKASSQPRYRGGNGSGSRWSATRSAGTPFPPQAVPSGSTSRTGPGLSTGGGLSTNTGPTMAGMPSVAGQGTQTTEDAASPSPTSSTTTRLPR